uniref:Uncharacterized protein n=1 Tax=Timema shepardi TaxID=629360 RepID=A0A7R9B3H1_TIMSH|nr:unnamed protein product [Timema shepardi]
MADQWTGNNSHSRTGSLEPELSEETGQLLSRRGTQRCTHSFRTGFGSELGSRGNDFMTSHILVSPCLGANVMEIQEGDATSRHPSLDSLNDPQHLHVGQSYQGPHIARPRSRSPSPRRGRSPTPIHRSPSPRRVHHDIGFSDTVSNVVEIVKHEYGHGHRRAGRIRELAAFEVSIFSPVFSDTVSNVVEIVKHEYGHGHRRAGRIRGEYLLTSL